MNSWTKPHHGVSHLENLPPGYQITVEQYGIRCDVVLMDLYSAKAFTPIKQHYGTLEECKAVGEKWASSLMPRLSR